MDDHAAHHRLLRRPGLLLHRARRSRNLYRSYESYGEDYWDTFPAEYNRTIDGRTMKTLLGRIMQYGYQGNLSLDWRSQNEADADKLAHIRWPRRCWCGKRWSGERDADFNHVDPSSADAVKIRLPHLPSALWPLLRLL